jgi:hypothetical protein
MKRLPTHLDSHLATLFLVPTRIPILFLTGIAAVPGGLALRANLKFLQKAHNLTPFVVAVVMPLQRFSAALVDCIMPSLPQLV